MKIAPLASRLLKYSQLVVASLLYHSIARTLTNASALSGVTTPTMRAPIVPLSFTEATQKRRTQRALESKTTVPDITITKLAEAAILTVPSAINSQTARLTVLFGDNHKKLWSITADALLARIGEERWKDGSEEKIGNYAKAYGTILFWNDESSASAMKENAPDIYKDKTDEWVHQSNGVHQFYLWTALDALGMGVNIQHYNPLIDAEVQKTWSIPANWKLKAQMVFGVSKEGLGPLEKPQKLPVEKRLLIFGATAKT